MVNFRDPAVVAQDALVLVKLWHAMCGLFIWEFFTTLDYEWSVIRGHRPYRWTIWVYSLSRVATIVGVVLTLVLMDNTIPINCQLLGSFAVVFSFLSAAAASLLIVLRVIAIWNKNRVVVAIAISMWGIDVAFLIEGAVRFRTAWAPAQLACVPVDTQTGLLNLIVIPITDVVLLLIMLFGLLRLRRAGGGKVGLPHLLWKQGLIWLLIVIITEIPPAVFVVLNLNDPFNVMFQFPTWVTMAVAATRIHRDLVDFAFESTDTASENPQNGDLRMAKTKQAHTPPTPGNRMEVEVHMTFEQHPTLQSTDRDVSISTIDEVHEKPNGLCLDDDVECGV